MSLVTRGMGGNSLLVTGGLGFKDLITVITEDLAGGGSQFSTKTKKRDLSFLQYTFTFPEESAVKLAEIMDEDTGDAHVMSGLITDFLDDKVIDIDGQDYTIRVEPDDIESLVETASDLDEKINMVMREADVLRKEAKSILIDRAKKEMRHVLEHQQSVFNDDFDLLEILLLADEL